MTDDKVKEALRDLESHRLAWREALEIAKSHAAPATVDSDDAATVDSDDAAYWAHELAVFDRTFAEVPALQAERDKLSGEVERLTLVAKNHERAEERHRVAKEAAEAKLTALVEVVRGYRAATHWIGADSWDGCSDCMDVLRRATEADPDRDMTPDEIAAALQALAHHSAPVGPEVQAGEHGWAPGGYIIRCSDCGGDGSPGCEKRAIRCKACAQKRKDQAAPPTTPTSAPVEEVGGLLRKHMEASGRCVWDREPDAWDTDWCGYLSYAERDAFLAALIQPQGEERSEDSGLAAAYGFSLEGQLAERLKDPEWLAKWNADEQGLLSFQVMLNALRRDEGDSVTLLCDNPDFNGQPNNAVECCGGWTGWADKRFTGDSLLLAVRAAYLARRRPSLKETDRGEE